LSFYQVRTWTTGDDSSKLKLSVISLNISVYVEWCGYEGSQSLFLILKSSVIIKMLFKLILVFFRYFKTYCWSE